jgi:hypothetical protein
VLASALQSLAAQIDTATPQQAVRIHHALSTLASAALARALEAVMDEEEDVPQPSAEVLRSVPRASVHQMRAARRTVHARN